MILFGIVVSVCLSACGNKGPLVLPGAGGENKQAAEPVKKSSINESFTLEITGIRAGWCNSIICFTTLNKG